MPLLQRKRRSNGRRVLEDSEENDSKTHEDREVYDNDGDNEVLFYSTFASFLLESGLMCSDIGLSSLIYLFR